MSSYSSVTWIAVNISLLVAIIFAMNKMSLAPIWKQWLIPTFLTLSLFTISSEKVIIYDYLIKRDLKPSTYKVERVPLLLAYTAHFFTTLSYGCTQMLEDSAHLVDDSTYNWSGHIYAGHSLFNTRKMRIIDEVTEENFRTFCSECVFRDLGLGLYTREELMQAPHLLNFLKERTSIIRGMHYKPSHRAFDEKSGMLSCHDAITQIAERLDHQLANSKELLFGAIGNQYQYLINKSEQAPIEKLVEQQIAIDTLKNFTASRYDTLASKRAEQLQMTSQQTMAALGTQLLVAGRNYFEALLYGLFPLVVIVSLISLGFKVLLGWIQIIAWISFWPPCFVIANYVLDAIWESKKASLGLLKTTYCCSTSDGLYSLYTHMEAIAGAIFISIPLLSWGLLYLSKGGASALVHWASSFGSAAQGSALSTAGEEVTGNYSYKNVGLSSQSFGNVTESQQNFAPFFSSATLSTSDQYGKQTTAITGEGLSLDQRRSSLITDLSHSEAFTNSLQSHLRDAESLTQSENSNFTQSSAHTANLAAGFNQHLSESSHLSSGWESSKLSSFQKQSQEIYTQAEEYGKSHNVDTAQAFDEALKAGAGFSFGVKAGADLSLSKRLSDSQSDQHSERLSSATSLYEGMQSLTQSIEREGGNLSTEEGFRHYQDFANSFNQTESVATQFSAAYNKQKSLEELESSVHSKDLRISENLNNAFINHLENNLGDKELIHHTLSQKALKKQEIDTFVSSFTPQTLETASLKPQYNAEKKNLQHVNQVTSSHWQADPHSHFASAKQSAHSSFIQKEDPPIKEAFQKAEATFEEKSSLNLLQKLSEHSTSGKMLAKASKFFQPSQQETKPSYYSKLPGWDQLTDEQKIAIIDMRISDDF